MAPETRTGTVASNRDVTAFLAAVPTNMHWVPRILVAATFLYHAFDHFANIDMFAGMMGLAVPVAFTAAYTEAAAAILLLAGGLRGPYADGLTRLGGLLIIPVMIGAITVAHWPRWSFVPDADAGFPMGGMEFQVTLIAVGLYFLMRGAPHRA